jgi:hypothetical protein
LQAMGCEAAPKPVAWMYQIRRMHGLMPVPGRSLASQLLRPSARIKTSHPYAIKSGHETCGSGPVREDQASGTKQASAVMTLSRTGPLPRFQLRAGFADYPRKKMAFRHFSHFYFRHKSTTSAPMTRTLQTIQPGTLSHPNECHAVVLKRFICHKRLATGSKI